MLYILDTDHISLLQRDHVAVRWWLAQIPLADRAVTVVILTEQLQGWLAVLHRNRTEADASRGYSRILETVHYFNRLRVLPYDDEAIAIFEALRQQKIRIGTQDLRIAAIVLRWQATLVTRNAKDFSRIPELRMVDWSA